jgi:hypothetical protein
MDDLNKRGSNVDLMEPIMSDNARYIAETRYAMKNEDGKSIEKVKDIL